MSSDFAPAPGEQLIRRERIHLGVFIIPVGALILAALAELPLILMLKVAAQMLRSLQPQQAQQPSFGILPFMLIILPLIPTLGVALLLLPTFLNSETTLTSTRLIYRTGFLSLASGELPLTSIKQPSSANPYSVACLVTEP